MLIHFRSLFILFLAFQPWESIFEPNWDTWSPRPRIWGHFKNYEHYNSSHGKYWIAYYSKLLFNISVIITALNISQIDNYVVYPQSSPRLYITWGRQRTNWFHVTTMVGEVVWNLLSTRVISFSSLDTRLDRLFTGRERSVSCLTRPAPPLRFIARTKNAEIHDDASCTRNRFALVSYPISHLCKFPRLCLHRSMHLPKPLSSRLQVK